MLRIRTLGGLSVESEKRARSGAATQPRRLVVLALISSAGERGITRDRLIALLWTDSPEDSARRALNQALHALRKDLDVEELFSGVQTLRLNRDVANCDLLEFEAALADQNLDRAAACYGGPFLDGFRVPGAAEFDRWADEARTRLAQRHTALLERLATRAIEHGDATAAVYWWRRLANLDPLNARIAIELMRALAAAGERHAALQHARIYEALLEQELAIEPDRQVVELADALRRESAPAPPQRAPPEESLPQDSRDAPRQDAAPQQPRPQEQRGGPPQRTVADAPPVTAARFDSFAETPGESPSRSRPRLSALRQRAPYAVAATAVIVLVAAGAGSAWRRAHEPPVAAPVLAVGRIADFRAVGGQAADPLAEMLATNLARVPGLSVLSSTRVLELLQGRPQSGDGRGAWAAAARQAGASELLEGGIHPLGAERLLLELRRVDLRTGEVRTAYRLEGTDVFDLVARATGEVATSLGRPFGRLDLADVSTRSLVGYRFYEEGLHAFARGDFRGAEQLFDAALREDSSFAMAAYHRWQSIMARGGFLTLGEYSRLRLLSTRAPDRERLLIQGRLAMAFDEPSFLAIAETLAVRYPAELDGHYLVGLAHDRNGRYDAAVPHFRRVVALDSAALSGSTGPCRGCDALQQLIVAYHALDSLGQAEAHARDWTRRDPNSARAWAMLASVLFNQGKHDEAIAARRTATARGPFNIYDAVFPAAVQLRAGDFEAADLMARALLRGAPDEVAANQAHWLLLISLRYQARWREALALTRERIASLSATQPAHYGRLLSIVEALIHFEAGRPERAAAIWDSLAHSPMAADTERLQVRSAIFMHTLSAVAYASAGDTVRLVRAVDSVSSLIRRSAIEREQHLLAHAGGLLARARADTAQAIAEFTRAIYSTTTGFTRSNRDLAELLMAQGRADEAIPLLQAALRGNLENTNLYITHTELHEMLGRAFAVRGQADSAAPHFRYVTAALANADPEARDRLERAVFRP